MSDSTQAQLRTLLVAGLPVFMAFGAAVIAPSLAQADPENVSVNAQDSRVEDVSLADIDLGTSRGMHLARERLHAMAERICAEQAERSRDSLRPNFAACVDSTLANALRNLRRVQTNATASHSVTRAASVSLSDLNLSTIEGYRIARERLEAAARRLCAELARSKDLTYQPNWAACVDDAIAGATAQAKVLAAEGETRTAQRR